ncbi:hypothetical protein OIV83_001488 [Microbotryomycetes sp. JL201]|nr:hypothetical protein OIV83_001488 [Microbotryomycetes sp. JL201]
MAAKRLLDSWKTPAACSDWSSEKLVGHLSLLLSFRRPDVALDTVIKLHDKGFAIPPTIAARILSMMQDELLVDPDKLAQVLRWMAHGFEASRQQGLQLEPELVFAVLMTLKRMGRTDLAGHVFQMWADGLKADQVGEAKIWSAAISLHALDKNTAGAYHIFNLWRARWKRLNPTRAPSLEPTDAVTEAESVSMTLQSPPDEPYSTMINYLAAQKPATSAQRDPVYRFLAIVRDDNVPLTVHMYNSLMRVELYRRRFTSFWGLWRRLADSDQRKNAASWRLAVEAKVARDLASRLRGRRIGSLMHEVVPQFNEANAPSARVLYSQLLAEHAIATGNSPRTRLSTKQGVVLTSRQLNTFLDMFVSLGDWVAAQIVIETFRTHRIEPDEQTHARVVVGVVKSWERDKLQVELDEARNLGRSGITRLQSWQERKQAAMMGGEQGLEMIQKIVEQRKMRVNLWTRADDKVGSKNGEEEREAIRMETKSLPPAPWMIQREVRELGYLTSLLRRCQGATEAEWKEQLASARSAIVPQAESSSYEQQSLQ